MICSDCLISVGTPDRTTLLREDNPTKRDHWWATLVHAVKYHRGFVHGT